jgi:hypothetical protein
MFATLFLVNFCKVYDSPNLVARVLTAMPRERWKMGLVAWGGPAMNRLDGKVALISGAARGIGGETARLMVEAGAKVAIGDVLDERGRETARTLGNAALYVHLDVTSEADWNTAVGAATGQFGKLDILVNNAGLFLAKISKPPASPNGGGYARST